ncbi:hypothetical protein Salat_1752700 [Sesamum alatum]|uniref:Uncharacterized protein n=1 Tax=Sesamum alatum TaxID=300844 RepID=A0AAE1Y8T0_9LAMI|nr:hypothetical protein Salat_1752700 [Sesamum alatum]
MLKALDGLTYKTLRNCWLGPLNSRLPLHATPSAVDPLPRYGHPILPTPSPPCCTDHQPPSSPKNVRSAPSDKVKEIAIHNSFEELARLDDVDPEAPLLILALGLPLSISLPPVFHDPLHGSDRALAPLVLLLFLRFVLSCSCFIVVALSWLPLLLNAGCCFGPRADALLSPSPRVEQSKQAEILVAPPLAAAKRGHRFRSEATEPQPPPCLTAAGRTRKRKRIVKTLLRNRYLNAFSGDYAPLVQARGGQACNKRNLPVYLERDVLKDWLHL